MRSLLTAALLVATAASPASAQCSDAEKKKLEEFDKAWSDATLRGDRAQLSTFFADDFMGATITGAVNRATTIDNTIRQAEQNRANPQSVPRLAYDGYVITCTPVTATVTHRTISTTTVNGRDQSTYSRSVHVLEKRGGRWQAVGSMGHALNDAANLLYMEADWNEAFRKRDAAWFERNFADDVTDIDSRTGAIQNKAQSIAGVKSDKSVAESLELSEMNVRVDGNVAVVTGVNRVRGRDEQGKPMDRRVRFTDTYIKRDGRWQVWATQGTTIP